MPSNVGKRTPEVPSDMFRKAPLRFVRHQYVRFLQGLCWYRPKGDLHWNPDSKMTDIFIRDESPIDSSTLEGKPAISITRAPVNLLSLGMDDMLHHDAFTDRKTKSVIIPGTMSMNCCSRNSQESEDLAFWVSEQLWLLRDIMQRSGFFQIGQNIAVGSPSPAGSIVANDAGKGWYCTTATSPYQLQRTGMITPLGQHVVRSIEVMLSGQDSTSTPTLSPPGLSYDEAAMEQNADLSSFDVNGVAIRGDRIDDEEEKLLPGVAYEVTVHGYRRRGERPPLIRGRRLPLRQEGVGESAERGIDAVKVKV